MEYRPSSSELGHVCHNNLKVGLTILLLRRRSGKFVPLIMFKIWILSAAEAKTLTLPVTQCWYNIFWYWSRLMLCSLMLATFLTSINLKQCLHRELAYRDAKKLQKTTILFSIRFPGWCHSNSDFLSEWPLIACINMCTFTKTCSVLSVIVVPVLILLACMLC